jgi:carboxypeptidase C (cathepsin A)
MLKKLLAIVGFAAVASTQGTGFPEEDRVNELWQQPDLSFGFYSGYLPIAGTQKELHYVAALSRNDPMNDPVIIWFNGGPGCSSMLGWAQEHGPYSLADGATNFTFNDWSWNNNANMIYIEAPAGVGYSICGDLSECNFDDHNSADDNLAAVLALLQTKFTALQNNQLFISGESYAGIYVPQLALRLDMYISSTKPGQWKPNFQGFMVGNGVTNWKYDCDPAYFHMGYYHGLISDGVYDNFTSNNCDFSNINAPNPPVLTGVCNDTYNKF